MSYETHTQMHTHTTRQFKRSEKLYMIKMRSLTEVLKSFKKSNGYSVAEETMNEMKTAVEIINSRWIKQEKESVRLKTET